MPGSDKLLIMDVKAAREAAGISQAELAKRTGMLQPKLSRIENGHIDATAGELALIEAALDDRSGNLPPRVEGSIEAHDEAPVSIPHLQPYPAAPRGSTARAKWVGVRNRNMQTVGVRAPESGQHGNPKKPKEK